MRRLLLLSLLAAALGAQEPENRPTTKREALSSSLDGRTLSIRQGPTLRLPAPWVARHEESGGRIWLQPGRTLAGREIEGDFDRELAELVDAVFDLRDCAFQGGGHRWGKGACYSGLTMRVYLVEASETEVEVRLDERGAEALQRILSSKRVAEREAAGGFGRGGPPKVDPDAKPVPLEELVPERIVGERWRRSVYTFDLHYGDYGATASVDVRLRGHGPQTLAVVFLHTDFRDHGETKERILASVRWPNRRR